MVEISPPPPSLIQGAHLGFELSSTATLHCQNSMKVNDLQDPEGQCRFARANFKPQRAQPRLETAFPGSKRGTSKIK